MCKACKELGFEHWSEHPKYPVAWWREEVANGNTRMGYWDWVRGQISLDEENI